MALVVNSNIAAMDAYRNLTVSNNNMQDSLQKLSSGSRINKAADDAAGLVISEGLKSQTNGLSVAVRNAQDGISVVQTAEGALNETTALLQRVRDLAVQASNTGANDQTARDAASKEVTADLAEIDRIAGSTKFGGKVLLDGSDANMGTGKGQGTQSFTFQVGADSAAINQVSVSINAVNTTGLKLNQQSAAPTAAVNKGSAKTTTFDYSGANAATTLNVAVDGGTAVAINLNAAYTDGAALATAVNSQLNGSSLKGKVTATFDATNGLQFTSAETGSTASLTVTEADGSATPATAKFGFSSTAATGTGTADDVASLVAAGQVSAIDRIDSAISSVSSTRADLGAAQNRLQHTINNLSVTQENLTASESRIADTDMASEMTNFTKNQILTQAGTAMLAQANQASQGVLKLLQG